MNMHHKRGRKVITVDPFSFLSHEPMSIAELAFASGLQHSTARNRLRDFEEQGIIKRKFVVRGFARELCFMLAASEGFDPSALDETRFKCFFRMCSVERRA